MLVENIWDNERSQLRVFIAGCVVLKHYFPLAHMLYSHLSKASQAVRPQLTLHFLYSLLVCRSFFFPDCFFINNYKAKKFFYSREEKATRVSFYWGVFRGLTFCAERKQNSANGSCSIIRKDGHCGWHVKVQAVLRSSDPCAESIQTYKSLQRHRLSFCLIWFYFIYSCLFFKNRLIILRLMQLTCCSFFSQYWF